MTDLSNLTAEDIQEYAKDHDYLELHGWSKERPVEIPELGSFFPAANWNHGDGHEMSEVVRHVQSGKFFMRTGTYSSWDSSDWDTDWLEAKPYEFVETRYEPK